jgi:hypothetical protein
MSLFNKEFMRKMQPKERLARLEEVSKILEPLLSLKILDEEKLFNKISEYHEAVDREIKLTKKMVKLVEENYTTHTCSGYVRFSKRKIYLPCCDAHIDINKKDDKLWEFYMCKNCQSVLFITRRVDVYACKDYQDQDDAHKKNVDNRKEKERAKRMADQKKDGGATWSAGTWVYSK